MSSERPPSNDRRDRLQQFISVFRHSQKYRPEYGAPVDGIPTGTGGRAAIYGGAKPNPSGTAAD